MKYASVTALLAWFCLAACDLATEDTVVGSSADTQIKNVTFLIDTMFFNSSTVKLVARGKAVNGGTAAISSPWYVEGQFYADSTYRLKLGGSYTQVGVPLSRGQEAVWTLTFSSGNVDIRNYPNFRVGDLRATYK